MGEGMKGAAAPPAEWGWVARGRDPLCMSKWLTAVPGHARGPLAIP